MKIKLEIRNHNNLGELIKIFGMAGYKVWRESEKDNLLSDTIEYLCIDVDKSCITE